MVLRVYSGADGKSHFEELPIPFGSDGRSPLQSAKSIFFWQLEPGKFIDFHPVSQPLCVITLSGEAEIGIGNGEVRKVGAGDVTLCEDMTGQGHTMRVLGNEPRVVAHIILNK